jgi:hypothetical protein
MKIIGGHDYYDAGLAYGRDETLVFVRDQTDPVPTNRCILTPPFMESYYQGEEAPRTAWRYRQSWIGTKAGPMIVLPITVWFAGRRHGGVKITSEAPTDRFTGTRNIIPSYFWDKENFLGWLDLIGCPPLKGRWLDGTKNIHRHFTDMGGPDEIKWIIDNRVAIAMSVRAFEAKDDEWKINATGLKDIQFFKKMPVMEAWQELSMFLGSMAPAGGRPMVEIVDQKIKRDKHGFDEWSFKKRKST